ncbi:MAG: acyl-CoA dehydrogenase family protein [Candidatus Eisenbacteria bacterium]|uniref:Acyl-CoA dehydrogenase family protein n=1 Tax=Eiseniibacteriota bacterium TaxID=2212470 RepID=A0A956NA97_UNCEI|nr:acyl-CoA dehydrogenase family protein [Candidatus Eisenbacteria bacterium]MCB9462990.1 acyl-CoA dehydrogenase family protein [Candidatus Eisenbacteria bacterium]
MGFGLSEEQRELQRLAREFAEKEIRPRAQHHDETGEFPREICQKAWELGLMNTHIPEEYGGLGLGVLDGALITEEMAAGCSGIATAMEANTLAEAPVIVGASDDQKKAWLAPMCDEFRLAAYCVTEPDAGSDVAGMKSTARKVGGEYILSGSKMWITNGGVADWYFVVAYTDREKGHRGMTAFVVPSDAAGIELGKKEQNMGQRASDTRAVTFHDVKVPEANRIGGEGQGWSLAMAAFDHTRPVVASGAVGVARSALEHALRYSTERETFGKPIARHQAIQFMIAEMARDVEAARLLVWKAAWKIDQGERNTLEAAYAKLFAADMVMRVTTDAVQVFGGYGFSREYPVEKLMRDAKVYQIYEGTSQVQRMIIARELYRQIEGA